MPDKCVSATLLRPTVWLPLSQPDGYNGVLGFHATILVSVHLPRLVLVTCVRGLCTACGCSVDAALLAVRG